MKSPFFVWLPFHLVPSRRRLLRSPSLLLLVLVSAVGSECNRSRSVMNVAEQSDAIAKAMQKDDRKTLSNYFSPEITTSFASAYVTLSERDGYEGFLNGKGRLYEFLFKRQTATTLTFEEAFAKGYSLYADDPGAVQINASASPYVYTILLDCREDCRIGQFSFQPGRVQTHSGDQ